MAFRRQRAAALPKSWLGFPHLLQATPFSFVLATDRQLLKAIRIFPVSRKMAEQSCCTSTGTVPRTIHITAVIASPQIFLQHRSNETRSRMTHLCDTRIMSKLTVLYVPLSNSYYATDSSSPAATGAVKCHSFFPSFSLQTFKINSPQKQITDEGGRTQKQNNSAQSYLCWPFPGLDSVSLSWICTCKQWGAEPARWVWQEPGLCSPGSEHPF